MDTKTKQLLQSVNTIYQKYFRAFILVFCAAAYFMLVHANMIMNGDKIFLSFMSLFIVYFLVTEKYMKSHPLCAIPSVLWIIGYYIYYWDSIKRVYGVILKGLYGY